MFGSIGTFVYRMRYTVIVVLIALMGGLGLYGMQLPKYLSQSGWFDPTSESVTGSVVADTALGRDHKSDLLLIVTPPEGTSIDDPEFAAKIETIVDDMVEQNEGIISREAPEGPDDHSRAGLIDPFPEGTNGAEEAAQQMKRDRMWNREANKGFISIGIVGNDDTTILNNYMKVEPFFENLAERYDMPGTTFQTAGLQPVAGAMSHGMNEDIKRAEVIALPIVALMLLFVFGGIVAAVLPVLIGGLTIAGSLGIMTMLAQVTELNIFAQSVVTLIGLGIAIDYGLFMVSRFREELAAGYTVEAAVRRSVMTSGQTIVFSATIIVAALACLLMFPQAFLKSVAYGAMASIVLAALLSVTVLPAILAILGRRVDALSVPFLNRTKTREEIIGGFWGKLSSWVMRHPVQTAVPTVLLLLALIIPFGNIAFGGISEKFLPPNDPHRVAQEDFDRYFPAERTEELKLVVLYDQNDADAGSKIEEIAAQANQIPGFTKQFSPSADLGGMDGIYGDPETGWGVTQMSAGLVDRTTAPEAIKELRAIEKPDGVIVYVAGTPALTQDSIDSLMSKLPLMAITLVLVTGLLMFLAFGSVILPIKAALMSALGLGSTLGILTWMFIDGHGSSLLNYTPGPLFAAMLVLIIAIVYGLSTDYEVFLLSRMVEARMQGASTTEAIRDGTALTGRLITAAAAILVVVTGAFGLSNIVMMKYIAFGMIAALILDATVIRMLLVPSVMKLLGDDCWWSPKWMLKLQRKIGLGEKVLEDEPEFKEKAVVAAGTTSAGTVVAVAQAETTVLKAQPRTGERTPAGKAEPRGLRGLALRSKRDDDETTGDEPADSGEFSAATAAPENHLAEGHLEDLVDDEPAREAPLRRGSTGPDTGSWRLGAGGVRLGNRDLRPRPQPTESAPAPRPETRPHTGPHPRPATGPQPRAHTGPQPRPQTGPQPRPHTGPQPRPQTGTRPATGPVRPQPEPGPQRPAPQPPVTPRPQAGPYPGPTPTGPNRIPPQYGRPADPLDPNVGLDQLPSTPPVSRGRRQDRKDQISVQELLRRSRETSSDDD
ncbi:RND transporter [Gordonia iterans]|uniref:RND transporter n=1 Tax=Gordonia iterans TaxID=1004901 RepID=A0A2S0KBF7_9ACTN|nr:MMPL family transporter [Gordonia iterans]AVL98990.1 RND transporter [Gordonia iterans]